MDDCLQKGAPMTEDKKESTLKIYQIRLQGHLDAKWGEWFYDLDIIHEKDGTTTLCGALPDQTVLHSVLDRIRDMNLQLISVNQIKPEEQTIIIEEKGENHEE
jgi:hypothetical protein